MGMIPKTRGPLFNIESFEIADVVWTIHLSVSLFKILLFGENIIMGTNTKEIFRAT